MVTTRGSTSFAELQKAKSLEYFDKFGRNDIIWIKRTVDKNSMGRSKGQSISRQTIKGDLQFNRKLISEYQQIGIAKSGDAIFYTIPSYAIEKNNEIIVDSITWRLVDKVESEQTNGQTIYQGWVCRRNP